jgi:hypothetical protein
MNRPFLCLTITIACSLPISLPLWLQAADERYQRVQVELKHTVEILHEEQERIVKIEAIKKSLEIEVKNLSVRLEEVEANAIVGGKRIISKLEARVSQAQLQTTWFYEVYSP